MDLTVQQLLNKSPPFDHEKILEWSRTQSPEQQHMNDTILSSNNLVGVHCQLPFRSVKDSSQDDDRPFLLCDYNKVSAGKYRSPWTNHIHQITTTPTTTAGKEELESKVITDEELPIFLENKNELLFNEVWDSYKTLYYGRDAVGSVYLKETDPESSSIEGCFGIQKVCPDMVGTSWDSISIVRAIVNIEEQECEYSVKTTILVILSSLLGGPIDDTKCDGHNETETGTCSTAKIGTTISKQCTKTCKIQPDKVPIYTSHIEHIGSIIEANEMELRSNLERVTLPKHQEVIRTMMQNTKSTNHHHHRPQQVNPLMGMMMNSDLLKKRLQQQQQQDSESQG